MFARLLILFYAIVSYAVFLVSFLYAVGFVGNYLVPKSVDVGGRTNWSEAIVVDLLLLGIFAIQHSIMARPAFKQWWAKIFPVACQRSTYVLLSSLILLLLFWQWRPIPIQVWQIDGIAAWLMIGVYWLGWLIVLASTFMIEHFDLFGLRQNSGQTRWYYLLHSIRPTGGGDFSHERFRQAYQSELAGQLTFRLNRKGQCAGQPISFANISASTLPPDSTMTTFLSRASM
jgi:protein-S-isoprenylcysteine O-methyltransferase Ste14